MADVRWNKLLRDAWLQRARSLLVLVALTLALTGAGTLLDTWGLIRTVTVTKFVGSHPVSATLRFDRVDDALLAAIRERPEIAAARARRVLPGKIDTGAATLSAELFVLSDWDTSRIGRLQPEQGQWPPRDGELVIETSAVGYANAKTGDRLALRIGGGATRGLPIAGVVRDVGLPPGWMDHVVYLYATQATAAELGAPAGLDQVQVVVRDLALDRAGVRRIALDLKELATQHGYTVRDIEVPEPLSHPHAAQMDSMLMTQGAFGALTLLVAAFLIVNLIHALLAGQVRQIGVMKAVGGSPAQIAVLYLGHALLIGVLSSGLSLPLAAALARPYAGLKADMLNFPLDDTAIPAWLLALQFAVGALLPVLAAALPVARACRMPVAEALRDPGIASDALTVRRGPALPGLSRPLQLALSNAFRRRQRIVLTLLALATGGAVFIASDNLRTSVTTAVDRIFAGNRYDVALRFADGASAGALEDAARKVDGVRAVQALASTRALVAEDADLMRESFLLVGAPPGSAMLQPLVEDGRWLVVDDADAIVVSRQLLRAHPSIAVGGTVALEVDGQSRRWQVVGVVESGPQAVAYVTAAAMRALRGDDHAATLLVATTSDRLALRLDAIARLRAALEEAGMPVVGSLTVGELRRVFEDHLLLVVQFLAAMGWVMIGVGALGLASSLGIAVLERRREIGVLRAIGAGHGTIAGLVVVESLVIAALSWLAALPLSMPISAALCNAFGRIMFSVPTLVVPRVGGMAIWLLLSAVVAVLAALWPARGALQVVVREALAYE